jgi:hypothetical protein
MIKFNFIKKKKLVNGDFHHNIKILGYPPHPPQKNPLA